MSVGARLRPWLARLAVLCLLVLSGVARAAPLVLSPGVHDLRAGSDAEVLADPSHTLTIEDVTRGAASSRFEPVTRPNLGYRRASFWVRFSVLREPAASAGWVVRLTMTPAHAELFVPRPDGGFRVDVSGRALPFRERAVQGDPQIAFRIEPPPAQAVTYYLRLAFDDTAWVEPQLYPEATYAAELADEKLQRGLYYGAILALIAYNALLFLVTRDRASFMYVVFELPFVLSIGSADRMTFEYLWPAAPGWAGRSQVVFGCAALFGALGFARTFLSLPTTAPRLSRVYAWLMAGALLQAVFHAAGGLPVIHAVISRAFPAILTLVGVYFIGCVLLLLVTGLVLTRRRVPGASTYLAAWLMLCVGVVVWVLTSNGVIEGFDSSLWLRGGSLAEATLLSLGLARRVSALQREREEAQASLLQARAQRLAALGRLVAGFAHEMGNPLNFVLGGAVEAAARLEEAESHPVEAMGVVRQALRLVIDGSERMKRILDNLRSYVRGSDVDLVAVDPGAAVRSTLALAAPLLERAETRVALEAGPVPEVHARPGELEQVFMNLVVNACQAMSQPGGELAITVSAEGGHVRVVFEDTGPGIPASEREAVFEPFFTTKEGRGGMGLGLYVSSDLVRRNGGDLRIEESGRGARFVVSLPCVEGRREATKSDEK